MLNAHKHINSTIWPLKPYKRPYGGTPGAPVMYEKPSDPEDEGAGYGYSNAEGLEENDIYFYHSDLDMLKKNDSIPTNINITNNPNNNGQGSIVPNVRE